MKLLHLRLLVASTLLLSASPSVWSESNNISEAYEIEGRYVKDARHAVIWDRCTAGMEWVGNTCKGEPQMLNLTQAKQHAQRKGTEWRLPTVYELHDLALWLKKQAGGISIILGTKPFSEGGMPYWSASVPNGLNGMYGYVDILDGVIDVHSIRYRIGVLFVRPMKSKDPV